MPDKRQKLQTRI